MKVKPVTHRIVVKPDALEEKTDSGIILARNERQEKAATVTGVVVEVGSTCFKDYNSTAEDEGIVPGVRIYYAKYAGAVLKDEEHIILNDEDVIGVIRDE
jgi:co-chaperonin GroES (HSP10)